MFSFLKVSVCQTYQYLARRKPDLSHSLVWRTSRWLQKLLEHSYNCWRFFQVRAHGIHIQLQRQSFSLWPPALYRYTFYKRQWWLLQPSLLITNRIAYCFCFAAFCDCSGKLARFSQPITCKTKANGDLVTRASPCLTFYRIAQAQFNTTKITIRTWHLLTSKGGTTRARGLFPSYVVACVSTISTFGLSGLSPLSSQPKRSCAASSRALSVLEPPRLCGRLLALDFTAEIVWLSLNLEIWENPFTRNTYLYSRSKIATNYRVNIFEKEPPQTCAKCVPPSYRGGSPYAFLLQRSEVYQPVELNIAALNRNLQDLFYPRSQLWRRYRDVLYKVSAEKLQELWDL